MTVTEARAHRPATSGDPMGATSGSRFCMHCGAPIHLKAEICPKCGIRQVMAKSSGRSRVPAALFALFLGGIGIHKFYLGKAWQGFLYLICCWMIFPSVIAFFEGIYYLTLSDAAFAEKYS